MKIKCPGCSTEIVYSKDNVYRPFCSARCKNQDIAAWATGENKISTPITENDSLSEEDIEAILSAENRSDMN